MRLSYCTKPKGIPKRTWNDVFEADIKYMALCCSLGQWWPDFSGPGLRLDL